MTNPYPQQPWPGQQPPQGYGYPQQPAQPAPGYGPPQGAPPPPPGYGYGPPAGYAAPPAAYGQQGPQAFDWGQLYNDSDPGAGGGFDYADGDYPAVATEAQWTTTQAGDKHMWVIKWQFTAGQYAGRPVTAWRPVAPYQKDGQPNTGGISQLFEELQVLGIPVGEKYGDPAGTVPFWQLAGGNWDQAGQMVAQAIPGRHALLKIGHDERGSKVKRIKRPSGAPAMAQPAPQPPAQGSYAQAPAPQYTSGPQAGGGGGAAAGQPAQPYAQAPMPPQAGQPGLGQFTAGGQAQQAGITGPPPGTVPQQAAPAAPPQPAQPALPFGPPQGQPPAAAAPPGPNGMPMPGPAQQPAQGQAPGAPGGPPAAPWSQ